MTDDQLAEIRERADAATKGPWKAIDWSWTDPFYGDQWFVGSIESARGASVCSWADGGEAPNNADARFMASAREDVPALLSEIDRLREQLHTVRVLTLALARTGFKHYAIARILTATEAPDAD